MVISTQVTTAMELIDMHLAYLWKCLLTSYPLPGKGAVIRGWDYSEGGFPVEEKYGTI